MMAFEYKLLFGSSYIQVRSAYQHWEINPPAIYYTKASVVRHLEVRDKPKNPSQVGHITPCF